MKALTLTQPWAQMVQLGAKKIETRGWSTAYRGPLAIHAAKGWSRADQALCLEAPFAAALARGGLYRLADLPLGKVIATVRLVDVIRTDFYLVGPDERPFGDYSPGRFAWFLEDVEAIDPVPARGALGLWEWAR